MTSERIYKTLITTIITLATTAAIVWCVLVISLIMLGFTEEKDFQQECKNHGGEWDGQTCLIPSLEIEKSS